MNAALGVRFLPDFSAPSSRSSRQPPAPAGLAGLLGAFRLLGLLRGLLLCGCHRGLPDWVKAARTRGRLLPDASQTKTLRQSCNREIPVFPSENPVAAPIPPLKQRREVARTAPAAHPSRRQSIIFFLSRASKMSAWSMRASLTISAAPGSSPRARRAGAGGGREARRHLRKRTTAGHAAERLLRGDRRQQPGPLRQIAVTASGHSTRRSAPCPGRHRRVLAFRDSVVTDIPTSGPARPRRRQRREADDDYLYFARNEEIVRWRLTPRKLGPASPGYTGRGLPSTPAAGRSPGSCWWPIRSSRSSCRRGRRCSWRCGPCRRAGR